jgi:hypothetical protein
MISFLIFILNVQIKKGKKEGREILFSGKIGHLKISESKNR